MRERTYAYAFTLVELTVAIAIVAIIAVGSVFAYSGIQKRAIETALQSDLRSAEAILGADFSRNGSYPSSLSEADRGKGVASSPDVLLQYTSDGQEFCLTASSRKPGIESFTVTSSDNVEGGTCTGHLDPAGVLALESPKDCPTGYIPVPGNPKLGTKGFCVMKYEVKLEGAPVSGGYIPVSKPGVSPRVNVQRQGQQGQSYIGRDTQDLPCPAGYSCRLIYEPYWLTMAADLIKVPSNWSGGAVGSGYVYNGHVNGNPASGLPASPDDNDGMFGMTGGFGDGPEFNNRRTLTFTNGEVIWDFSGNVAEWVGDSRGYTFASVVGAEYNAISSWGALDGNKYSLSSLGLPTNLSSANGIGKMQCSCGDGFYYNTFIRGGGYNSREFAGPLNLNIGGMSYTASFPNIGYRLMAVKI